VILTKSNTKNACVCDAEHTKSSPTVLSIRGIVVKGLGAANQTLRLQMPYFAQLFPEIEGCYFGSINLRLEVGLRVSSPDFTTPLIPWAGPPGEQFSFLRIDFEGPLSSSLRCAWIYLPHGSPHLYNPFSVEVITKEKVQGISHGVQCRVHIAKAHEQSTLFVV
jgi:hypothetical protein